MTPLVLSPAPYAKVQFTDRFWAPRLDTNRTVTIPWIYEQCRRTGRLDALRLQWKQGDPNPPHVFWESDIAKWLEAASYTLSTHPTPELESKVDEVIHLLQRAQQPDGYLNAYYSVVEPGRRWTNLRDKHELYCAGHLIEAGVAHFEATGKKTLLDVVCRYADLICEEFTVRRPAGYCGHPEIELALIRLHEATAEPRYLQMSRSFIERRGHQPPFFDEEARVRGEDPASYWAGTHEYTQSHQPVRDQVQPVGHAVRALYLFSAVAALARWDRSWLEVCQRWWDRLNDRHLYLTGGIGAARANEGFAADYALDNETAYAETCAGIASVLLNHRLLQLTGDGRYADEMERALYNAVLGGVGLDGKSFFYANPLTVVVRPTTEQDPYYGVERREWFGCACCPPNIARLFASLGQYFYSQSDNAAAVHLYATGCAELSVGPHRVVLRQETDYPWKGRVQLHVEVTPPGEFELWLRLPGWCPKYSLALDGQPVTTVAQTGYIRLRRTWRGGEKLDLQLAMPVERLYAHPAVRDNLGHVALQRGPLVYCFESAEGGPSPQSIALSRSTALLALHEKHLLGGITTLQANVLAPVTTASTPLYLGHPPPMQHLTTKAVPFAFRAHRGACEMSAWIRELG